MSDDDERYTLDEAERALAREVCATLGHDWRVVEEVGTGPTALLCDRCGDTRDVVVDDGGYIRNPAPTKVREVSFAACTADWSKIVAVGAGRHSFDTCQLESHGRNVTVTAGWELDEHGQFRVALYVDGKERYVAHFTPRDDG